MEIKYNVLIISALILIFLDFTYLYTTKQTAIDLTESVQKSELKIKYSGLIACYIVIILGLYYFILLPEKSYQDAFLLGLFVNGVYETTNYATFSDWTESFVVMDMLWGGILYASTTYLTYYFTK